MSVPPASSGRVQLWGWETRAAARTHPGTSMGTAWLAVPALSSPSHLALSNREVVFIKNKITIPYSKNISKLWGHTSKMLPLPLAVTHSEYGSVSSGQGNNLLFVKSSVMGQNSTSNTRSSFLQHLTASYQATGEKKKSTLPTSSAYSLRDCPLVSVHGHHKDKNGPFGSEQNPIFKRQSKHKLPLSTLQQYHLGREVTFYD